MQSSKELSYVWPSAGPPPASPVPILTQFVYDIGNVHMQNSKELSYVWPSAGPPPASPVPILTQFVYNIGDVHDSIRWPVQQAASAIVR
jgi:hypothetical protein